MSSRSGTRRPTRRNEIAVTRLITRENTMKASTKDELAGKVHEVKGAVKEEAGHVTGHSKLEAEGAGERVAGKVQKKIGQVEKVFEK
jgi:uncharacterized protein YjbJ (UPF0337 family)